MSTPNDGGAAFPVPPERLNPLPDGHAYWSYAHPGMTLRDYLAAAALQGMMAHQSYQGSFGQIASKAYAVADAMLAKRAKTKEAQP